MLDKEYYGYLSDYKKSHQKELSHYGIPGQKWGVRRWQYEDGRFNEEGKLRYFGSSGKKDNNTEEREVGITTELAALALTAGVTALEVGAIAAHDAIIDRKIKKYEEHLQTEKVDEKTGLRIKDEELTTKEDMKDVNMEYKYILKDNTGCTRNCMYCTTTMELKARGYDVKAGKTPVGKGDSELKKWFKGLETTTSSFDKIISELKSQPEGARGNLMFCWKEGGAHSVFYKIENGRVAIYDAQCNRYIANFEKSFGNKYYRHISKAEEDTWYARTDNLEPNYDYLKSAGVIKYK